MASRFNLTDEFLAMTYPDDYYKSVIEPAKLGKGPIPSKTEMLLKSQPFKAVTLPAREALNPGSVGAFRSSGTPMASRAVGLGRMALGGPFGIAALTGQGIGMGVDAIARATNTPEEYEAMKEASRAQGGFGYFDDVDISQDAVSPVGTNEPMDIEDFLGTSTPQDLGFIGMAPGIKEAVAPVGITDRGRGMIGGQAVPVGDVLGRQMALEKEDFFEEPKSRLDAGGLLSLVGLLTQARPIQALSMIANRDKIARGIDRATTGIGSLGSKFARKMRGVNPDGTIRTQSQYEEAREARRAQKRTDRMIDRIASGKRTRSNPRDAGTTKAQKDAISAALQDKQRGAQYGSQSDQGTGGSTKIVCTMMNERYGFGSFRNKIWMKFHESYGPEYQKGYHAIFLPLVKIAKGEGKINTAVRKVLEHMGRHVTADMFKIMKGKKRDTLGRIYRAIFEPTCRIIGKIKSALGRG